jgi:hypothetical protein
VKGYWGEGVCQEDHEHGEVRILLPKTCDQSNISCRDVAHLAVIPNTKRAAKLARNTSRRGQLEEVVVV